MAEQVARLGVTALETAADGTVQSLAASGFLVLVVLCVIVPLVGFFHGRRLMREPFAVAHRSEATA